MVKNKYVGHRYIPIFENGWDKTRTYEPLTFVYYEGKTYVSRQLVPTNIEITDNDFWAFFMDNAPQIFTPTFMGEWEDKTYDPLSIVIDNGNTYVSKQDVPIGTLLTDTTYWLDLSTYYNQLFTDYETAEQERQQAELIRVENDKKRETEIADIKSEIFPKMINNAPNSNFANGLGKWVDYNNRMTITQKDGYIEMTVNQKSARLEYSILDKPEDKWFMVAKIKSTSNLSGIGSGIKRLTVYNKINEWEILTGYHNPVYNNFTIIADEVGSTMQVEYAMLFNITSIFGEGNEPTKEVMDWIIKENGYFDELTLKRDDLQQYEINQLRKAVIALGGTI